MMIFMDANEARKQTLEHKYGYLLVSDDVRKVLNEINKAVKQEKGSTDANIEKLSPETSNLLVSFLHQQGYQTAFTYNEGVRCLNIKWMDEITTSSDVPC